VSWSELERVLSGRPPGNGPEKEIHGDGGDSPAWTRRRERYTAPAGGGSPGSTDLAGAEVRTPYAELHCHSNFSFLDGASHPEELVEAAALLGLDAIAITDHDGMYGVVRFAEAAKELGVRTVFGAELSLGLREPQNGIADPEGEHLLLLATGTTGYARLCRTITSGQLADDSEKGRPVYDLAEVVEETADDCVVLTGCRKGAVRAALLRDGPAAAFAELTRLA
jgi:error-prone DNA polymerase